MSLESMTAGNIAIVGNSGGITEYLVDGKNGFIIKPEKDELVRVIKHFIDDRNLLQQMNEYILNMDCPYTMEAHAKEMQAKIYS